MSTDPTALAREVLDAAHEDETVTVCTIPDNKTAALARAVIAVQAVVEEFACAVTLDRGLSEWESMCDHFVKKFHAALNGENA